MKLIQDNFPLIDVREYHEKDNDDDGGGGSSSNINNNHYSTEEASKILTIKQCEDDTSKKDNISSSSSIDIPINSLVYYFDDNEEGKGNNDKSNYNSGITATATTTTAVDIDIGTSTKKNIIVEPIIYPWNFLNTIQKILGNEIRQKIISPNASVAKSAIIDGPCIIEDNVTIDDFCKIKGPVYIGKDSYIGTSSLIRECMIGDKTNIGFSCEIRRTYLAGHDKIAHFNSIGDSVIGKNVWFAGHSGISNVLLTKEKIRYEIDNGKSIDIGTHRFGSVIGDNCRIGASVTILPGRYIPPNTVIQAISKTYQTSKSQ
jgi:acetyltransferase-like isoleucine patch superfamily enzyme